MRITDFLPSEDFVAPELLGKTKEDVIRELAAHLSSWRPDIDAGRLVNVLWERERLGSTAIGDGIAIPHGKISGLREVVGVFARHPAGVDFASLDGRATQLFFLLVAPDDSVGEHLKALARVSRLLKDSAFRERLLSTSDRAELFRLIREEDDRL